MGFILFEDGSRGQVRLNTDTILYLKANTGSSLPNIVTNYPDPYTGPGQDEFWDEDCDFAQMVALLTKAGIKGIIVNVNPDQLKYDLPEDHNTAIELASQGHDPTRRFIVIDKIEQYQEIKFREPDAGTAIYFGNKKSFQVRQTPQEIDALVREALGMSVVFDLYAEHQASRRAPAVAGTDSTLKDGPPGP